MSIADSTKRELERINAEARNKLIVQGEADTRGRAGASVTVQRDLPQRWTVAWFASWWKGKGGSTGVRAEKEF
jgi:hypothetical protein